MKRKYISSYVDFTEFQDEVDCLFMSYSETDAKKLENSLKRYKSVFPIQRFNETDKDVQDDEVIRFLGWEKKNIDKGQNNLNFSNPSEYNEIDKRQLNEN